MQLSDDIEPGFCPRKRWMEENNETIQSFQDAEERAQFRKLKRCTVEEVTEESQLKNLCNIGLTRFEIAKVMSWTFDYTNKKLGEYKLKPEPGFPILRNS